MKEGLLYEEGELRYYKNGELFHAGVVEKDGKIYYIDSTGRAVKGHHVVHRGMGNGILQHGTYKFADDYTLVKDAHIASQSHSSKSRKKKHSKKSSKIKDQKTLWFVIILVIALVIMMAVAGVDRIRDGEPLIGKSASISQIDI